MENFNSTKIGHRNYAVVDIENLTAEEKAAVDSAKQYQGIAGYVPMSYEVKSVDSWDVHYGRVYKTLGYTIVLDIDMQVRFIHKGYLTCDEVSLLNKGKPVKEAVGWMKYTIFLIQQSMK